MPHFVIECSGHILSLQSPSRILQSVHDAADATGLFGPGDIKVRINPYALSTVGNRDQDFIHVFAHIMHGRDDRQKRDLSERIIRVLTGLFPDVPVISMNVSEFDRATYCNRTMI